jgi:prophage tail gpP-like protein
VPNLHEVAQLQVGGVMFEDWETVYVQHRWQEGWPIFRFSAAEGAEQPFDYAKLQFKPGDQCQIILGGQLAVTGIITQRQVSYSAAEHGVQLSGVGKQWAASTSSVPSEKNQNNFDKMPVTAIAQKVVGSVGGSLQVIGSPDNTPFERMQSQPGELVFDFLDKIARMRNATLGSDHLGNLLLIGEHSNPIVQQLTEGFNILKMQCVFSSELMYSLYKLTGQHAVDDEKTMKQAAQIVAQANGGLPGLKRFLEIVTEQPVKTPQELQQRATYEALKRDGTQITANVTVQGWLRDGGALWRTGDNVTIYSPMCPLNLGMKIQTATFTQDNRGGTTTLLECVLPWMLGDKLYTLGSVPQGDNKPPMPAAQDTAI